MRNDVRLALRQIYVWLLLLTSSVVLSATCAADALPWIEESELWWHTAPVATGTIDPAVMSSIPPHVVSDGQAVCGWVYLPNDSGVDGIALRLKKNGSDWIQAHWGDHTPSGLSNRVADVPAANASWHQLVVDLETGLSSPVVAGDTITAGAWATFEGDHVSKVWWDQCIVGENDIGPVLSFPEGSVIRIGADEIPDALTWLECSDNKDATCASLSIVVDDSELLANVGVPGIYQVVYTATDSDGNTTTATLSVIVDAVTTGPALVMGMVNHDIYTIGGNGRNISHLTGNANFPDAPSSTLSLDVSATGLQTGPAPGKRGQRLRGYLIPNESGDHKFWIASSDESELWLSTDDDPVNAVNIAKVQAGGVGWTPQYQWNKYSTQGSASIALVAGQRYYIEVRHVASGGGRRAEVAWREPSFGGDPAQNANWVIPGSNLALFLDGAPLIDLNGSDAVTHAAGWPYIETATCTDLVEDSCLTFDIDYGTLNNLLNPPVGVHTLTYTASDSLGNVSEVTRIVEVKDLTTGELSRHLLYAPGATKRVTDVLNNPKYPDSPDLSTTVSVFRSYQGGSNYGQFLRGYLIAPETGSYRFWIASKDSSRLFVSPNADSSRKVKRAEVPGTNATAPFEWTKFSQQQSANIQLVAGQVYFVEAVHRRRWSNGEVAVAWKKPGDLLPPANDASGVIPGIHLAPEED